MADSCCPVSVMESPLPPSIAPAATALPKQTFWKSTKFRAILALIAVYVIWGTTLGAMHFGVQSIPPGILAFSRYLLVALILLGISKLRGEAWPTRSELRRHAISGVCLFTAGNATAIWAVQYIPTVLGAALMATTPFWMIGLSAAQSSNEKLSRPVVGGIVLGFLGILTILAPQLLVEFSKNSTNHLGLVGWLSVLGMLSTCGFWAFGSLYAKKRPTSNSVLMEVGMQNLAAAIVMLPFSMQSFMTVSSLPPVTLTSILALAYLAIVGTIIAVPCYFYVLKHLPVSLASTFAYVSPVIAMLTGYWFLGESLSPTMSMGAVLILLGVILVQSFQKRAAQMQPTPIKPLPLQREAA